MDHPYNNCGGVYRGNDLNKGIRAVGRIGGFILILGWCLPSVCIGGTEPIDIGKAIELGFNHNHELKIAAEETQRLQHRYKEVRAEVLPIFSASTGYARSWILPSTTFSVSSEDSTGSIEERTQTVEFGTPNNFNIGLSLEQPIYSGGRYRTARRLLDISSEFNKEKIRQTEQRVVLRIQETFLNALLAKQSLIVSQQALTQAQAHLEQVRLLFEGGVAADFDLLRAEVQVANLHPEVSEAKNRVPLALAVLKNAIGLPLAKDLEIQGDFDHFISDQVMDLQVAHELALAKRSELRQLAMQVRMQREQIQLTRAALKPKVSLTGNYEWQWQLPDASRLERDDFRDSWVMGIFARMPLFDGGKTSSQVKQVKVNLRQLDIRRAQLVEGIQLQIEQSLLRHREAGERIEASAKTVEQAEKGLHIAEVRYQHGVTTQIEVMDVQVALTRARLNRLKAQYDYALTGVLLQEAIGKVNYVDENP